MIMIKIVILFDIVIISMLRLISMNIFIIVLI